MDVLVSPACTGAKCYHDAERHRDLIELTVNTTMPVPPVDGTLSFWTYTFTCAICIFGIFSNLMALTLLHRARPRRNKKQLFMLNCLIINDFITLLGKLVRTSVKYQLPYTKNTLWMCRCRVLFRFFAWGSACATFVMAVDRWLALTKPFFYQRHIRICQLKRMMHLLWFEAFCLVFAPYFGFGLYWDEKSSNCESLIKAKKSLDVVYAYIYFSHGAFLCFVLIYLNLAVIKALWMKDDLCKHGFVKNRGSTLTLNSTTETEISFGWLMVMLCVLLVTCFVPKLLATVLYLVIGDESKIQLLIKISDTLLFVHFALDPWLNAFFLCKSIKSILTRLENRVVCVSRSNSTRTTNQVLSQLQL